MCHTLTYVFNLVQTGGKLDYEIVDVIHETEGKILGHASWSNIRRVEPGSRNPLVELHHLQPCTMRTGTHTHTHTLTCRSIVKKKATKQVTIKRKGDPRRTCGTSSKGKCINCYIYTHSKICPFFICTKIPAKKRKQLFFFT